jgi:penicillin-binding protein 2
VQDLNYTNSVQGGNLQLTIDHRLQQYAYELTGGKPYSICLIDLKNYNILAAVSSPSFDINTLSIQISSELWNSYRNNPYEPLVNRLTNALYPPGSTFKLVVALAALESGIDPSWEVHCPGHLLLGRAKFSCWKTTGHGSLNLSDALKHSCNVYFYNLGLRVESDAIKQVAHRLGLGREFKNIPLPQSLGLIPNAKWKLKQLHDAWRPGNSVINAIGQGFLQVNCLQLAVMAATVATGKLIEPRLIYQPHATLNGMDIGGRNFDPQHLNIVREAMFRVVNEPGGTAQVANSRISGFEICGKTGTGQAISHNFDKHEVSSVDFFSRSHGLFVGFAPYKDPKFAVSVISEHGGFGASVAAPIGRALLVKAHELSQTPLEE